MKHQDVFTAGVERGGVSENYEIRILICWLFYQMKTPITATQLNSALLREQVVNYFALSCATAQLLASGHLQKLPIGSGNAEAPMELTELGEKVAVAFEKSVPLTERERSLKALRQWILEERFERENKTEIQKVEDGYQLTLSIPDMGHDLLSLSIYAPTVAVCEQMKRNFVQDPTQLYRAVLGSLLENAFDVSQA